MTSVEFEDENNSSITSRSYQSRTVLGEPVKPSMITLLKKIGVVKTDAQAYYTLLAITLVAFLIAGYVIFYYIFGFGQTKQFKYNIPDDVKAQLPLSVQEKLNAVKK